MDKPVVISVEVEPPHVEVSVFANQLSVESLHDYRSVLCPKRPFQRSQTSKIVLGVGTFKHWLKCCHRWEEVLTKDNTRMCFGQLADTLYVAVQPHEDVTDLTVHAELDGVVKPHEDTLQPVCLHCTTY